MALMKQIGNVLYQQKAKTRMMRGLLSEDVCSLVIELLSLKGPTTTESKRMMHIYVDLANRGEEVHALRSAEGDSALIAMAIRALVRHSS